MPWPWARASAERSSGRLWGARTLEGLSLGPWASRRRQLLETLDQLEPVIDELDRAVIQEAEKRPAAVRLMTQPGVGPVTALAFVLTIGPVSRFQRSKQVVSHLGLNPMKRIVAAGNGWVRSVSKATPWCGFRWSSSSYGLAPRSGIAAGLSAIEVPPWPLGGQGSHRTKVGGAAVWEAA